MSLVDSKNFEKQIFSDRGLLENVLKPYKINCHYLKNGYVEFYKNGDEKKDQFVFVAKGEFSIPESCYIKNTGHFNSVEFNICYNQLTYYLLAECIENNLISDFIDWNINDYHHYQLSNMLILRFQSSFHVTMKSNFFEGFVKIKKIFKKNQTVFIETICQFNDNTGGYSTGKVLLAIVNSNNEVRFHQQDGPQS